jgi:dipeptidyl aminopeptidase/acylaminoacyl peptidase
MAQRGAIVLASCLYASVHLPVTAQERPDDAPRAASLYDFYSELNVVDSAMSPSGRYIAAIVRRERDDILLVLDLAGDERKVVQRVGWEEAGKGLLLRMATVHWKSDERILLRLRVRPEDVRNFYTVSELKVSKLGDRMFSIERANGKAVPLLGDNRNAALEGAFDLGAIGSFLPKDPQHVLMVIDGFNGASLFKVNIETGRGEQLERPSESVVAWWLDVNGNPVVRISENNGTRKLFRKDAENKWRLFHKHRIKETDEVMEYEHAGASSQPGKHYLLARPPSRDRVGLYLYDLEAESFGEPLIEHPVYDLQSAAIARDGTRVLNYCYMAHVRTCESTDPKEAAHLRGLRKYFEESANVYVYDTAEDGKSFLLLVEGPHDPPAYYYYQTEKRDIQLLGSSRKRLEGAARPTASVVSWKARDGKEISGYLTLPVGATATTTRLPLVVHPHGGPEARDHLAFDRWVQYFAARGYAVFQPNFRGSAGFGKSFAESGYGEWGRAMQNDITDGVKMLVEKGTVDASRMCIVGASYGGYASLIGVATTPEMYRCAVSIAGVTDLEDFISWRKRNWGSDSEGYKYWLKAIGDPDAQAEKLRETSPVQLAARIKVPVLLIHGTEDFIVPIAQSRAMKRALEKAGRKTDLLEYEKEGHTFWSDNEYRMLGEVGQFLWTHLGAGHGVTKPPPAH